MMENLAELGVNTGDSSVEDNNNDGEPCVSGGPGNEDMELDVCDKGETLTDPEIGWDLLQSPEVTGNPFEHPEAEIDNLMNLGDNLGVTSHADQTLYSSEIHHRYVDIEATVAEDTTCSDLLEPKMCNEKTATYWTGGGNDSPNEDDTLASVASKNVKMDTDNPLSSRPENDGRPLSNVRVYFPLQKTLRNLRLLDLKLKYNARQAALEKDLRECANDSSSEESDSEIPEDIERGDITQKESEDHNSSLITLLSHCQLQLEQFEMLKHYSQQQAQMLWEAQETIAYLKENVASLERQNKQNEDEIFFLYDELVQCKRLLHDKTERITDMKEMFKNFSGHLQSKGRDPECQPGLQLNDQSGESSEIPAVPDPDQSKICVIL